MSDNKSVSSNSSSSSSSSSSSRSSKSSTSSDESGDVDFSDFIDLNKKVLGDYHFIKKLGYGAYAQVWLTYNHKKKDFYALKVQHPDDFDEAKDEIKILTKVRKLPYCVQLIESFVFIVEKKQKYNVMVFPLYGINLHDLLKKKCFDDGMPEDMVEKFTKQTLMNLDMLHNKYNLIHCDLKPDNFLLSEPNYKIKKIMESYNKDKFNGAYNKIKMEIKGGVLSKKEDFLYRKKLHSKLVDGINFDEIEELEITDEELFKMIRRSDYIMSDFGSFCDIEDKYDLDFGTRYYRSPENIMVCEDLTYATDVWSLGCTVYEMLTNRYLFDPDKSKEYTTDHYHLSMIFQLGKCSNKEIKSFARRTDFFKKDKSLKRLPETDSLDYMFSKISGKWLDFVCSCLTVSYKRRPLVKQLMSTVITGN